MFYNYNSLSFLLFYVCHLLATVINGQQHLQQPQPVPQPKQYYGHHKVYSPNGTVLYARSYNLNDAGYTENLFTKSQMYGRSFSQPPLAINHQVRNNQGYSPGGGDEQAFRRFLRYRSITPPPMVAPQIPPQSQLFPQLPQLPPQFPSRLPSPMARPVIPPAIPPVVPPPVVSPNVPRYGPGMPQNQFDERAQYQSEYSRNTQRQTVGGNEVTVPHSYNFRDEPTNRMINYFSSDFFKSNVKENKLTTVSLFQNTIIGKNITADEAIIRANLEKTPGQNFDNGTSDCRPMLTVVKFGNINQPEIIYNPSSVKVYRCPQACFSWQFDCLPVKKISFNFTAAVYTMERDRVTREVNQFEVDSHTECACQCQTVASCLASPSLSNKRPKSNF